MMCSKVWIVSNRPFPNRVASNPADLERLLKTYEPEHPERIYFPFWSWKVPNDLLLKCDCIGFHSTPLPFGRGGSPIQNMIRLGYQTTELCMFRMTKNFDEGEILCRREVWLKGTLGDIISRISSNIESMIKGYEGGTIISTGSTTDYNRVPLKFNRIVNNHLSEVDTLEQLYDEIRMRDEEGHPKAFIWLGKFRIDFTDAFYHFDGKEPLKAKVEIYKE